MVEPKLYKETLERLKVLSFPFELPLEVTHYIGGEFVKGENPFPVIYPATGEVIGSAPEGRAKEVDLAVEAAHRAFQSWGKMPPSERRPYLRRFAEKIREYRPVFEVLESLDVGRPIRENRLGYVDRMANNIEFFADFAVTHGSEAYPMENGYVNYVLRFPVGVAALITPWNMPSMLATWKIGPTLAFGNTAVLKPAEFTPLGAWLLARCAHEAGLPPGVFNVVHGFGPDSAGELLTKHPLVRLISFTGETTTGRIILKNAADTLKRTSMELGGKAANLIFASADLDRAVEVTVRAAFFNQGEVCLAGSRLLVERPVYEPFVEKLVAAARALRIGDPLDPETQMGALIAEEHLEKVMGYVEHAKRVATVLTGGKRPDLPHPLDKGYFLEPTVVVDVAPSDKVCQEEIFGPMVAVLPFDTEEEAIALANNTPYGLNAIVQTRDVGQAVRVSAALEVGTVWVNDWFVRDLRVPFGGAKQSGIGREGGHYGYEFYYETKNVCIANR
ncbi:NAD-dependent aldehyde dehydrogenase (plasmid) [Thermus oshimai JL-2]|uniref:NAD-dependent aldehyde dehydrogenase n=1 Tax=Thermus oshimai JL-2 TaxID=751945 RepID=K7RM41_THEOS|nr:aldehyde dehydrogenase [Thermus oshimai]AFV77447.1 NAD-dependent aldehyde dehydrogenase [Thermus oshimai JL-2]